jgi:hypothetical protein
MSVKSFKTSGVGVDLAPQGLVLINTTSFSGVSSVSLPAATFSATYDNYLIKFNKVTSSVASWAGIRMRASGSDDSTSNYRRQHFGSDGTSASGNREVNQTSWAEMVYFNTYQNDIDFTVCNPFSTTISSVHTKTGLGADANPALFFRFGGINTSTSYDSLSLIKVSGTFSGDVSVYGFSK